MEVIILATGRRFSSIDSYSEEFSVASGSRRIVLRLSKKQISSEWPQAVEVIDGFQGLPFTDGWAWNILTGRFSFSKLRKNISGNIVHYSTFGLPILSSNPEDIVTIHDLFFLNREDEAHGKFVNISEHFLKRFLRFRNVIVPSNWVKEQLRNYGFKSNLSVIYIPPPREIKFLNNKNLARSQLGLPKNKKLILSISSNLKRKNLDTVVKTMRLLGDEYKLVRVGPQLGNAINFNPVKPEQLNLIYNACDIMLFPTLDEGFGKPVVEAFASGLPVVTSDIPIMKEVAGDAALRVKPTPEYCASGIEEISGKLDEFRNRGLERAQFFSRESFNKKVNDYYESIKMRYT